MPRRIIKFTVDPNVDLTPVETADDPKFLAVGTQGAHVVVWCEATPGYGHGAFLRACMTGENAPGGQYIGTTQVGPIVVHVYRSLVTP